MPKKIRHESFRYAFLTEAHKEKFININNPELLWPNFLNDLSFDFIKKNVIIRGKDSENIFIEYSLTNVSFYKKKIKSFQDVNSSDSVKQKNQEYFRDAVLRLAKLANFSKV